MPPTPLKWRRPWLARVRCCGGVMRESYRSRRLSPNAFRPRQRRVGEDGSSAHWLHYVYTPRWRQHLAILIAAVLVIPFGVPAARSNGLAGGADNPVLAWLQG